MKTIDFNFDNVGGMVHLYLIDVAAIRTINTNISSGKVVPVLKQGATIYDIKVYDDQYFQFNETMSVEDTGSVWDINIQGFIPRLDNLVDIANLERGEWMALHQDANGNVILSGTKEIPLRFISTKSTSGRNATAFSLSAKGPEPSLMAESSALQLE